MLRLNLPSPGRPQIFVNSLVPVLRWYHSRTPPSARSGLAGMGVASCGDANKTGKVTKRKPISPRSNLQVLLDGALGPCRFSGPTFLNLKEGIPSLTIAKTPARFSLIDLALLLQ